MIAICCDPKFRVDFTHSSSVLAVEIFKSGSDLFLVTLTGKSREKRDKGKREKGVERKKGILVY